MKRSLARAALILPVGFLALDYPNIAFAQAAPVDLCTGLRVSIPALVTTGTALDTVLSGALGNVFGGAPISLSLFDSNGQLLSPSTTCTVGADGLAVNANQGITIGGGQIDGLGGTGSAPALAGTIDAIALGNGATTSNTATGAVALGTDAHVTAAGGVALGADSVASRAGLSGGTEAFSGTVVASTAGAVSVGDSGSERQITNVAGGTQATDAVNLRQLTSVDTNLENQIGNVTTALGGGANYNSATNVFTGPTYQLRGVVYNDIGTALTALEGAIGGGGVGGLAATNTSGKADAAASAADSTAVGYGANAAYDNSTALGNGATTTRANQVAIGTGSNTYTMAGVASDASRAAQIGATQVLTTDAYGNIASADVDLGQMKSDISSLKRTTDDIRKEERRGIATAMAMAATPTPSAPGKTAWATNVASFSGQMAGSFAVAHRIDIDYPLTVSAALGYSPGAPAGVRLGVAGEF
jgi:autotransporter adhesin